MTTSQSASLAARGEVKHRFVEEWWGFAECGMAQTPRDRQRRTRRRHRERIKALERENKELRRADEILKSASFAQAALRRRSSANGRSERLYPIRTGRCTGSSGARPRDPARPPHPSRVRGVD